MEKAFYGVSMGLINSGWNRNDPKASGNYFVHIMKRLIREFKNVDAQLVLLGDMNDSITESETIDSLAREGFIVFTFQKSQYFTDVQKTAELIVEDVARELLNYSERFTDEIEKVLMIKNFKMCFRPYCIEEKLPSELLKEEVIELVSGALEETVSKGRGIPLASKPTIVEFLSEDGVKRGYKNLC